MLRRNRGLLIFMSTVAVLGIGLRLVWDVTTDRADPPIWVSILVSLVVVAVAMGLESWDARRQARRARAHVEGPKPTNPDGTPFGYHQLRAGGWEFCDGCRKWGQGWTPENPHQCQETYINGPVTNRKASR
jgi:hypothetical protein